MKKLNLKSLKLTLIFLSFYNFAQAQFSEFYGQISNDSDKTCLEYVTCLAVDDGNDYEYVGVQAYQEISSSTFLPRYKIRGIIVKDDGTLYTSDFYEIDEQSDGYDIVPLKIIRKEDNSGYVITGYCRANTAGTPYPFVITTNTLLSPTLFRVYEHYGFFADVDELPSGDFLFCGAWTNTTNVRATQREAMLMRTNSAFVPQLVRLLDLFTVSGNKQRYNVINDAIVINNNEAIICGSLTNDCDTSSLTDTTPSTRTLLARFDFNAGNITWQKCDFISNYFSARLAVDLTNNEIALALNAEAMRSAAVVRYDLAGNFISGEHIEMVPTITNINFNGLTTLFVQFDTHVPFIQNIYYNTDRKLFLSGKFIKLTNSANLPRFDMPWCMKYEPGVPGTFGLTSDGLLFKNVQQFRGNPADLLTNYKVHNNVCVGGTGWQPMWAGSNTLPRVSGINEYVTITNGVATVPGIYAGYKSWVFTNDASACGAIELIGEIKIFPNPHHFDATIYIHAPIFYEDINEIDDNHDAIDWNCNQDN